MVSLPQLISHRFRGFSKFENSIEGLNAVLDFGVKQVEFDIRVARCGTPLIYHDEIAPDANGQLHQICEIIAKDRHGLGNVFGHIPTADALFSAASRHPNKAHLLVDMKDAGFEDMLVALAKAYRLEDRITWVSWLPETLYAIRDLLPDAKVTLSHWCKNPNATIRSIHKIYEAKDGYIPRPSRRHVLGERSGWFIDGPLRGDFRDLIDNVCVPANMLTKSLVEDYQADGISVSAFSYISKDEVEKANIEFGLDDYFIDAKAVFDKFI